MTKQQKINLVKIQSLLDNILVLCEEYDRPLAYWIAKDAKNAMQLCKEVLDGK